MAQADGVVANGSGAAVRAEINAQLAAVFTNHSGATQPSTIFVEKVTQQSVKVTLFKA